MLHDNMKNYLLMVHDQQVDDTGLRERVGTQRGQGLMKVVFPRVSLISKTRIGSRRGLIIKFLLNFQVSWW